MTKMIGPSHHFFRAFMKPQNSEIIASLLSFGPFIVKSLMYRVIVV